MKKITLFSLLAVSVLFTACGEETKETVSEVNTTEVAVKKETANTVEEKKPKMTEANESVEVSAVEAKAVEVTTTVQEKAAELTETATNAVASGVPEEVKPVAYVTQVNSTVPSVPTVPTVPAVPSVPVVQAVIQ